MSWPACAGHDTTSGVWRITLSETSRLFLPFLGRKSALAIPAASDEAADRRRPLFPVIGNHARVAGLIRIAPDASQRAPGMVEPIMISMSAAVTTAGIRRAKPLSSRSCQCRSVKFSRSKVRTRTGAGIRISDPSERSASNVIKFSFFNPASCVWPSRRKGGATGAGPSAPPRHRSTGDSQRPAQPGEFRHHAGPMLDQSRIKVPGSPLVHRQSEIPGMCRGSLEQQQGGVYCAHCMGSIRSRPIGIYRFVGN